MMPLSNTLCKWVVGLFVFSFFACSTKNLSPAPDQERIRSHWIGKKLWLKRSMYSGMFFDDDRFYLLDEKPFEQIDALKSFNSQANLPPPAQAIVPYSSTVEIVDIQWPTTKNVFNRPLYSPKNLVWAYVRIDANPKKYIVLLPAYLKYWAQFNDWLSARFSTKNIASALKSVPFEIREGIMLKKPVKGMSYEQLLAALGQPTEANVESITKNNKLKKIATFGSTIVVLESDRVVDFKL